MAQQDHSIRTLIFMAVAIGVIAWLMSFSMKKNAESGSRSKQCSEECTASGNSGYEFKWNILSGPACKCIP